MEPRESWGDRTGVCPVSRWSLISKPHSILPTLLGKDQEPHEYLYWEFFERGFQQAVRFGPYKGLRLKQRQPLKLFDLRNDLGEQTDIASRQPQIVEQIEAIMEKARTPSPYWPK